jgi:hypothetical protein
MCTWGSIYRGSYRWWLQCPKFPHLPTLSCHRTITGSLQSFEISKYFCAPWIRKWRMSTIPYHAIHLVDLRSGSFAVFRPLVQGWPPTQNLCCRETFGVTSRFCLHLAWLTWPCRKGEGGRQPSFQGEGSLGNAFEGELWFGNLHDLWPASPTRRMVLKGCAWITVL